MNFTIRIYKPEDNTSLADFTDITLSGITIIRKAHKFARPEVVKGNLKKFGYSVEVKGKFLNVGGTNTYPCITFKGNFIDIEVKNFPRFPVFTQDKYAARSAMNGYTPNLGNGFPIWLMYRKCVFNINTNSVILKQNS